MSSFVTAVLLLRKDENHGHSSFSKVQAAIEIRDGNRPVLSWLKKPRPSLVTMRREWSPSSQNPTIHVALANILNVGADARINLAPESVTSQPSSADSVGQEIKKVLMSDPKLLIDVIIYPGPDGTRHLEAIHSLSLPIRIFRAH